MEIIIIRHSLMLRADPHCEYHSYPRIFAEDAIALFKRMLEKTKEHVNKALNENLENYAYYAAF
jgi:hypothetical protein